MAAYELLLLNTAIPQIQAAQSGDTYVCPRDIAFSAALTLSAGTANGVPYLNASKVLTTGSALTFDGTSLGVGGTSAGPRIQARGTINNEALISSIRTDISVETAIGSDGGLTAGFVRTVTNHPLVFGVNNAEQMRLTSTGLKASIAGTNADPVFSYTSDTNTGIFFPAADKLGFTAGGGSDQMVLTTTGLGIGTSSPLTGLSLIKYGSQWTNHSFNTYPQPAGNTFLQMEAVAAQANWFGFTGSYGATSGSANLLLQVNLNNTSQQAGNYIASEAQSAIAADLTFGKMVAGATTGANSTKSEQMRIEGSTGNVGIGTSSPAQKLDVRGANSNNLSDLSAQLVNSVDTTAYAQNNGGGISFGYVFNSGGSVIDRAAVIKAVKENSTDGNYATSLVFANAANSANTIEKMRLDSSGNLGLGVTPSASWVGGYTAFQMQNVGRSLAASGAGSGDLTLAFNAVYDNADARWEYAYTGDPASRYSTNNGAHYWYTAPSGTAGNPISFTQAMTLDASGRLGVGATNPDSMVEINSATAGYARFKINYNSSALAYFGSYSGIVGSGNATDTMLSSQAVLAFGAGGTTERARITSGGDFQTASGNSVMVGGTAARATTAGTNRVDIFDGTAPVGTLANGVSFYSASGEANVMDAAGNATLLSPHDAETNEWIFRSKHTPTGKVLKIDVERLLKFVNDHFGLDAVHEFVEK